MIRWDVGLRKGERHELLLLCLEQAKVGIINCGVTHKRLHLRGCVQRVQVPRYSLAYGFLQLFFVRVRKFHNNGRGATLMKRKRGRGGCVVFNQMSIEKAHLPPKFLFGLTRE